MKMVDFDVAEVEYNMNKNKDIDIYSISYNKLVEKLRHPQKYVLLKAFGEIYSLEVLDVTDTAFFLKLTDDAIKHYTRVEEKIIDENEKLKKENKDLKTSKEYWRKKCLSKDSYNKLYHKAPIWFTQSAKLTDKQANEIAEAIEQDLKERRIKE